MNKTERQLPFPCQIIDKEPEFVTNPFSGEKCLLKPDALAVYDTIKGSELIKDYATVRKGLDWFMSNNASAYMVLLD